MAHAIPAACHGEYCRVCAQPATHKLEEVLFPEVHYAPLSFDNGRQVAVPTRHPLSAYVCCVHFDMIVGPESAARWAGCSPPPPEEPCA